MSRWTRSALLSPLQIADDFEELQSVHFLVRKQPVQDLGVLADKSLGLQSYYAAFELALCHHLAFGTAKDDDKSRFWLTKSGKAYEDFHHAISVAQERRDYHGPLRDGRMSEYLEYDPGVAYSEMGLLDDAISALREEADGKEGIGQVVHSQLALQSHMSHLLSLRDRAGDREDDLQLRKLIAERTEEVQGPEDPNTLLALTRYAKLLTDFDEAEVIHRRVLAARRKIHAANHPDILKAMDTLARTLLFKGGDTPVAEALALLKEAHTETVAKFGATHPQCITLGRHLGRALMANHQLVDAETILGDSMQYAELHFGKLHYEYEATEREFVSVLYRRGRKQEALGIAQSAIRIQEAAYGVDGDRSMRIVRLYVSIFWVRDAELVIGIQRQLVDNMRRKRGKDMATAAEVRRLGLMCHQLGLTKDCIKAYEEYVGYYKTLLGMKDSKTVKSATFLARAYRQDGQLRRAVDVFFQFEDVSAMEAGVQLDVLNDWKRYMEYCCECSLWNSAIQLQKRVVELVTSSKGSTDMDIIYEQQRLADLLEHSE
jgi:tetratricopeptide (TPR) repeat protein